MKNAKNTPVDQAGGPEQTGAEDHHHDHGHEHDHSHDHAHEHHAHHEHHHHDEEPGGPVLTVRAASGLSGDMMLAGLAGLAGLRDKELNALVKELKLPALDGCLSVEPRSVNHIAGVGCRIELPHEHAHRNLADIRKIIADSAMPDAAKELSTRAFTILAEAEAAVHGKKTDEVSFHEVGALDSILDTCMVCKIFTILQPVRFVCSPLPVADGVIHCAHGHVPSPAPAVLRLLEGVPVCSFPGQGETVTPTALSLLKALGATFGGWPAMVVEKTVISYGGKVFPDAPNGAVWVLGARG
jgi:uncharacterized protein (DUF111 family)